jgi:hypothetical protein
MSFIQLIPSRFTNLFPKKTKKTINFAGLVLLMILVGCQPAVSTAPPTPEVLRVAYTPAVKSLGESLHRCAESLPLIGLAIDEVPADLLASSSGDLTFRLGLPEKAPAYAAVVGWEEVVIVVNSANVVTSLPIQMVSDIYNGKIVQWNDVTPQGLSQPVQVWSYPPGDELNQIFQAAFLSGKTPAAPTYLAPDADAMLEAISKNPAAIGFLLKSQLNGNVHQVVLSGETSDNLRQPILSLAQAEPQGNLRQLLLCLQKP